MDTEKTVRKWHSWWLNDKFCDYSQILQICRNGLWRYSSLPFLPFYCLEMALLKLSCDVKSSKFRLLVNCPQAPLQVSRSPASGPIRSSGCGCRIRASAGTGPGRVKGEWLHRGAGGEWLHRRVGECFVYSLHQVSGLGANDSKGFDRIWGAAWQTKIGPKNVATLPLGLSKARKCHMLAAHINAEKEPPAIWWLYIFKITRGYVQPSCCCLNIS